MQLTSGLKCGVFFQKHKTVQEGRKLKMLIQISPATSPGEAKTVGSRGNEVGKKKPNTITTASLLPQSSQCS